MSALLLWFFTMLALSPAARCQDSSPVERNNEFGVWGAYSVNSPSVYGSRAHGSFGTLAFRYGRFVYRSPRLNIEYTLDIAPVEVMHQLSYAPCSSGSTFFCVNGHETVYGGGANPFGWKFSLRPEHQLQIFGGLVGGFVASVDRIPTDVPGGTLFNFNAEIQVGFERFNASRSRAWFGGYKLEHISNGFRTNVNPGVDLNVLFLGYSFFK